jgi:exosome complex RNA-binding protein Csl4
MIDEQMKKATEGLVASTRLNARIMVIGEISRVGLELEARLREGDLTAEDALMAFSALTQSEAMEATVEAFGEGVVTRDQAVRMVAAILGPEKAESTEVSNILDAAERVRALITSIERHRALIESMGGPDAQRESAQA